MEIIPVIDILDGKVVHAVKGERNKYRPVKSILTKSPHPLDVAKVFKEKLGLTKLYIADINSILEKGNNFRYIEEIKEKLNPVLLLDYGIKDFKDLYKEIIDIIDYVILGTETINSVKVVEEAIKKIRPDKLFVSIDIKGQLLTSCKEIKNPLDAVNLFRKMGIKNFIILDLNSVGTMLGLSTPIKNLVREITTGNLYIAIGGGVKNMNDIDYLKKFNVNAVLTATSLHKGNIIKKDIELLKKNSQYTR